MLKGLVGGIRRMATGQTDSLYQRSVELLKSTPDTVWGWGGHAARGALVGGLTGGASGFLNDGFSGAMGGALSGALWGGGLSAGLGHFGVKGAFGASPGLKQRGTPLAGMYHTGIRTGDDWRGFSRVGVGGAVSLGKNIPKMKATGGAYIGSRLMGGGFATSRISGYLNARISTVGGIAGGLIGGSSQKKSHSTLAANGWGMGTAGPGYFY